MPVTVVASFIGSFQGFGRLNRSKPWRLTTNPQSAWVVVRPCPAERSPAQIVAGAIEHEICGRRAQRREDVVLHKHRTWPHNPRFHRTAGFAIRTVKRQAL